MLQGFTERYDGNEKYAFICLMEKAKFQNRVYNRLKPSNVFIYPTNIIAQSRDKPNTVYKNHLVNIFAKSLIKSLK